MNKPGVILVLLSACLSLSAPAAANDPPSRVIFLHYDYMVAADHSHAPDPRAIELVVDAFRRQGITLHVDPRHAAIPERRVVTFGAPDPACAGDDAVDIATLRKDHFEPRDGHDWHYAVFAHGVITPDVQHSLHCPADAICSGALPPPPDLTGFAELPGRNFVVSLGLFTDNAVPVLLGEEAATFMHELGHNFGLTHGGSREDACRAPKPNYISVMNRLYQALNAGILVAPAPGSSDLRTCSADADCGRNAFCERMSDIGFRYCARVDYSDRQRPGLNELSLDERVGVSGLPTDTDLVVYRVGLSMLFGPSFGPIDWNGDGDSTGAHVAADINSDGSLTFMRGFDDWAYLRAYLDTPGYRKDSAQRGPGTH